MVLVYNGHMMSQKHLLLDKHYKCCVIISVVLGKSHYLLYHLVSAMQPRMLVTFDEDLRPLPVAVRVGQVMSFLYLYLIINFLI